MDLTCYHCAGTKFYLVVMAGGETKIVCVNHDAHLLLPLAEERTVEE